MQPIRLVMGVAVLVPGVAAFSYGMASESDLYFLTGVPLMIVGALIGVSRRFWARASAHAVEAGAEFPDT